MIYVVKCTWSDMTYMDTLEDAEIVSRKIDLHVEREE